MALLWIIIQSIIKAYVRAPKASQMIRIVCPRLLDKGIVGEAQIGVYAFVQSHLRLNKNS